jgi:flagellar assembly protein FliH
MSERAHPAQPDGQGQRREPPRADGWQRWRMATFDRPAPSAGAQALPPEQQEALEQLRQAARAEGQAAGYAAGHALGLEEGRRDGLRQGHEQGREAGHAEGYAAGAEAARREAQELQAVAEASAGALDAVQAEMGQAMVSLALDIAQQILRSTLAAEPERILDVIREIFHAEPERQSLLELRLHPSDLELVRKYLEADAGLRNWRLSADPAIERGGCMARTALGDVDATIQTRWRRVAAALGKDHPWRLPP